METRRGVQEGMVVYSADGEKLGKVLQCEAESFIIEKGFFFPKDYIARYEDVADVSGGEIHLSHGKSAFTGDRDLREGQTLGARSTTGGESYGHGAAGRGEPAEHERPGLKERVEDKFGHRGETRAGAEDVRVPIAEERLDVAKRDRQTGEARVKKDVVTEHQRVDVPVMKERVHVERVPASERTLAPGEKGFEDKSVAVPIHEEEVEVRKHPVVKEEVRLRKERDVEHRAVEGDVRKERVDIQGGEGARTIRDPDKDRR